MVIKKVDKPTKSLSKIIIDIAMTHDSKNKSDLIKNVWLYCKDNNITKNMKGTDITMISIRNCLNETIRYIVSKKRGCWKTYRIIDNENVFKIEKRVIYFD